MYFPYLRGRQFELLALRELMENGCIGKNIIPVIEPIKLSSTLTKTIETYVKKSRTIAIIHNSKVGNFLEDFDNVDNGTAKDRYSELLKDSMVIKSHIFNQNSSTELMELYNQGIKKTELLVIANNREYINEYSKEFFNYPPSYSLIPDERAFKRTVSNNKVLLNDKFIKQERNVDYEKNDDEFFSDDHLFYEDEGYTGFSDFSIVGDNFSESGYAPYAVTIHIVYFDKENNLRIKHFVSDSNEDISNPAKKFYEALSKLVNWQKNTKIQTYAVNKFVEHFNNQTYPGLGTVKKLSIMHHIELISKYLDEV